MHHVGRKIQRCSILKGTHRQNFSIADVCDQRKNIFLYYLYFRFYLIQVQTSNSSSHIFFSCGKTTQIPQFILDSHLRAGHGGECFIICTQPRRISAMSVAERVSSERVDKIGQSVGYQVRLENKQVITVYVCKHLYNVTWMHRYKLFRRQRKMFFFLLQVWNKEKILSPHEQSNLTTLASMF